MLDDGGRRVEVVLSPTRQRLLSQSLHMPYTWVELQFYGYTPADQQRFLERFDRAKPALADIDGDGKLDLLVGTADGHVMYFQTVGTA